MKAMCINEKKDFVWQDVPDPVCHGVCALLGGGGYAEEVVVPEGMVMPMPKGFDFWEAAEAHAILERGENRGKVVLSV